MSTEPSRAYSPGSVEPDIYALWLEGGHFHADPKRRSPPEAYSIVIPPPNVTGALHLGHALNNTLQDTLIRRKRMQGLNTLWMPGVDHAGIATQAVVEKQVLQNEKKNRHDLGREELVRRIWAWKEQYGDRIVQQLKLMGCSCDWARERFTLDPICARAVREWFFRLFRDGLIFRGKRLVNWDTHLQTAVADDEVYHETVKGHLWHIRYPILSDEATKRRSDEGKGAKTRTGDGTKASAAAGAKKTRASRRSADGETSIASPERVAAAVQRAAAPDAQPGRDYLVVATTRPETMLADTALAVHPEDDRYAHLAGKLVVLPLTGRAIPIIADGMLVKREFGTGCVKVTPGHDPNDYACYQRHPEIGIRNMMTPEGRVNEDNGGDYAGLKMEEARKRIVADLEAAGLLHKVEDYETDIGHSDRSKTPIQPYLSDQWFVRMGDGAPVKLGNGSRAAGLAQAAIDAVCQDDSHYEGADAPNARKECTRMHIFPRRYARTYTDWLSEKRDWCISRQLWWGHRLPVWKFRGTLPPEQMDVLWQRVQSLGALAAQHDFGETDGHPMFPGYLCLAPDVDDETIAWLEQNGFERDPDVLDTWFSSALWPLSTMGWPGEPANAAAAAERRAANPPEADMLKVFYPTSVLSTAREIITLWVARMVISGLYNDGRVPFRDVVIHPVIQDGQGRPMKKMLGNGVDPVDIIEMYGADALRFTLASMATETQDIRVPVKKTKTADGREVNSSEKFELGRNFCNKLWQAATGYILPNVADVRIERHGEWHTRRKPEELAVFDRWIRSRLVRCIERVDEALDAYQFSRAAETLRDFVWNEFCDWYLEESKIRIRGEDANDVKVVLLQVLDIVVCLLHPIAPYITEAIWQEIGRRIPNHTELIIDSPPQKKAARAAAKAAPLIVAPWPAPFGPFSAAAVEREITDIVQPIITALRQARMDINASRSAAARDAIRTLPHATIRAGEEVCRLAKANEALIRRLGSTDELTIDPAATKPPRARSHVHEHFQLYVPVGDLIDLNQERKRLKVELGDKEGALKRAKTQLANEAFVQRAAPDAVQQARDRATALERQFALIAQHLADLE